MSNPYFDDVQEKHLSRAADYLRWAEYGVINAWQYSNEQENNGELIAWRASQQISKSYRWITQEARIVAINTTLILKLPDPPELWSSYLVLHKALDEIDLCLSTKLDLLQKKHVTNLRGVVVDAGCELEKVIEFPTFKDRRKFKPK